MNRNPLTDTGEIYDRPWKLQATVSTEPGREL